MYTRRVMISLFVLVMALSGAGNLVHPLQAAVPEIRVVERGWARVDFRRRTAAELWADAGSETPVESRWRRVAPASRPRAVIMNIYGVARIVGGTPWDVVVFIGASSLRDLDSARNYIERFYSHVDLYRVTGEFPKR